jgi:hypothetical protein
MLLRRFGPGYVRCAPARWPRWLLLALAAVMAIAAVSAARTHGLVSWPVLATALGLLLLAGVLAAAAGLTIELTPESVRCRLPRRFGFGWRTVVAGRECVTAVTLRGVLLPAVRAGGLPRRRVYEVALRTSPPLPEGIVLAVAAREGRARALAVAFSRAAELPFADQTAVRAGRDRLAGSP